MKKEYKIIDDFQAVLRTFAYLFLTGIMNSYL